MPRQVRKCPGGLVYHVWNRAAGRLRLFKKPQDYAAFNRILTEAHQRHPIRILEWCLMPNHWHFVVFPEQDQEITKFFRWLTHTHSMRAITHRRVLGMGPLYQGRFKTLPVETDPHLATLLRYVQRNPVRAKLVQRPAQWKYGALWARRRGDQAMRSLLTPWPIPEPQNWDGWSDESQSSQDVKLLREHIRRSRPYGSEQWMQRTVARLGLEWTVRQRGRPALESDNDKAGTANPTVNPLKQLRPL